MGCVWETYNMRHAGLFFAYLLHEQVQFIRIVQSNLNGKPAAGLGIKLATGANALDTAKAIKAKLAELPTIATV